MNLKRQREERLKMEIDRYGKRQQSTEEEYRKYQRKYDEAIAASQNAKGVTCEAVRAGQVAVADDLEVARRSLTVAVTAGQRGLDAINGAVESSCRLNSMTDEVLASWCGTDGDARSESEHETLTDERRSGMRE